MISIFIALALRQSEIISHKYLYKSFYIFFLNIIIVVFAAPIAAEDDPVLKEQIIVHTDLVTLGDLFDNAGIAQNVAVFQSPKIGTTGTISSARVILAAKRHGLIWNNPGNIDRIQVKRPSRHISLKEIKTLIEQELAETSELGTVDSLDILIANGARGLNLDSRNKAPVIVMDFQLNSRNGVFRAVIGTEELNGNVAQRIYTGRVIQTTQVIVPSRMIEFGGLITTGDIKTTKLPLNRVNSNHVRNTDFLVGKVAKRILVPNRPIRQQDVQFPKMVKKNERVNIRFNAPGISLRTKGKALQDGLKGDEITVMNLRSERKVQAIVIGPGTVSVTNSEQVPNQTYTTGQQRSILQPRVGYKVR